MGHKSIDELRVELGLPKGTRGRGLGDYVLLHLAFRMKKDDATKFLLECDRLNTSESLFARLAILEKLNKI